MAYNIPSNYNTDNFTFGPGVLSIGVLASGLASVPSITESTDITSVGAVRSGGTFSVTRTKLEVNQGSPITLVKQFVTQETANITVNGIEWDLDRVRLALGAGVTTTGTVTGTPTGAADKAVGIGGDLNVIECGVKLTHDMPSGGNITIKLWRAQGSGEMTVTFGDDLHEIPYSFDALECGQTGWDGLTLTASERLFRIEYTAP